MEAALAASIFRRRHPCRGSRWRRRRSRRQACVRRRRATARVDTGAARRGAFALAGAVGGEGSRTRWAGRRNCRAIRGGRPTRACRGRAGASCGSGRMHSSRGKRVVGGGGARGAERLGRGPRRWRRRRRGGGGGGGAGRACGRSATGRRRWGGARRASQRAATRRRRAACRHGRAGRWSGTCTWRTGCALCVCAVAEGWRKGAGGTLATGGGHLPLRT